MTTFTVKPDKKQAAKIARWARSRKVTKADVIRDLIERAGPVETGDDLAEWVARAEGKGLGLAQKTTPGWWPPPKRAPPRSWVPTASLSSASVPVTCGFGSAPFE